MATIKSYTDLSQSKALSKILPLESADMYYEEVCNLPEVIVGNYILHNQCMEDKDYKKLSNPVLSPAWSLSALLGVIKEQGNVDLRFLQSTFDNRGNHLTNVWCCTFEDIGTVTLDLYADNPVDACYEMILKLNELKML